MYYLPDWLLYVGVALIIIIIIRDCIYTKFRPITGIFTLFILAELVVNYLETAYYREAINYWSK